MFSLLFIHYQWCFIAPTLSNKSKRHANLLTANGVVVYNNLECKSVTQIAHAMDIKDESTLRGWIGKDHSIDDYKKRGAIKGAKCKLTEEQQTQLREWVLSQCNYFIPVKSEDIQMYCLENFDWKPQAPWVSKCCWKNTIRYLFNFYF